MFFLVIRWGGKQVGDGVAGNFGEIFGREKWLGAKADSGAEQAEI